MRQAVLRTKAALAVLLAGTAVLLWSTVSFAAPPTMGANCGAAASIVGTDSAGKVKLGTGVASTCTLTFALPSLNAPAWTAMSETGRPAPVGTKSTTTTLVLDGRASGTASLEEGGVVSYLCVSY